MLLTPLRSIFLLDATMCLQISSQGLKHLLPSDAGSSATYQLSHNSAPGIPSLGRKELPYWRSLSTPGQSVANNWRSSYPSSGEDPGHPTSRWLMIFWLAKVFAALAQKFSFLQPNPVSFTTQQVLNLNILPLKCPPQNLPLERPLQWKCVCSALWTEIVRDDMTFSRPPLPCREEAQHLCSWCQV